MVMIRTALVVICAQVVTSISIPAADHHHHHAPSAAKAVYFASNHEAANSIYALPVDAHGHVSAGTITLTDGKGGRAPSVAGLTDAFNSQGALQRVGNMLLTVNPGSNTVSMFKIDPKNPLKLTLVGKPVDTLGDFPNTIAASTELRLACVANSGTRSGIACFRITNSGLKPLDKAARPLTLTPVQKTPPVGPFNTVSQTFFSADLSALLTTVKGDPTAKPPTTGYLSYFPIKDGLVSRTETRSSPNGTAVLFGSVALRDGRVFTTDASFGTALLSLDPHTHAATVVNKYVVPNNGATCWLAQSPLTGDVYTTDDGVNQIVRLDARTGNHIATTMLKNGNNAMIEIQAAGSLLYAITHGNATVKPNVIVMSAAVGHDAAVEELQTYFPTPGKLDINVEGLALLLRDECDEGRWAPHWHGANGGWSAWWGQ